jgi:predicted lipase
MNKLVVPEHHLIAAFECKRSYKHNKNLYSLTHGKNQWITINGTSTVKDWIYNLDIKLNKEGIHSGFRKYTDECLKEIDLDETMNNKNINKIILCGHSLGAVSSTLMCYDIMNKYNNKKKIELVLFGSPKPGGKEFKNKFNELAKRNYVSIYRYLNGFDIVEDFPQLSDYDHITESIYLIDGDTNKVINHHIYSYINSIVNHHL